MNSGTQYSHQDALGFLGGQGTLREKLQAAHRVVQERMPFISRIALTLYDPETSLLKAYLHSSGDAIDPLGHYQTLLDNAPSLKEILKRGRPRVINTMLTYENECKEHVRRLGREGYAASYTLPMFDNGIFVGFLFYNSYDRNVFTEQALHELDLYGHLISLMVVNELGAIRTLTAAVKTTSHITHLRDPETGSHLDRMSRYCRIIARELAAKYQLDDDYIEHVFMFAPLHDIGKIAIPDHVLLKPGRLSEEEREIMKTHPARGTEIIDELIRNFGLDALSHVEILRNIAACHHETVNGSGYPAGLSGGEIPLEARIVAVADVFDALTSERPYKKAWSNEAAFDALRRIAGEQLDRDCVDALLAYEDEIGEIQRNFGENTGG